MLTTPVFGVSVKVGHKPATEDSQRLSGYSLILRETIKGQQSILA